MRPRFEVFLSSSLSITVPTQAACQKLNQNSSLPTVESREENSFVNYKTHNTIIWLGAYRKYAASYTDQESLVSR